MTSQVSSLKMKKMFYNISNTNLTQMFTARQFEKRPDLPPFNYI